MPVHGRSPGATAGNQRPAAAIRPEQQQAERDHTQNEVDSCPGQALRMIFLDAAIRMWYLHL